MSNSGRLTGIGMHGTLLLAEHAESLRPGFRWGNPFKLADDPSVEADSWRWTSGEDEAVEAEEEEETCRCVWGAFAIALGLSLMVTVFDDLDMAVLLGDERVVRFLCPMQGEKLRKLAQ